MTDPASVPRTVVGEDAIRELLKRPGVVFTWCGYQYRTTNNGLECLGIDAAGGMDWLDVEHELENLTKHQLLVLKEPIVYDGAVREELFRRALILLGSNTQMRLLQDECVELISTINRSNRMQ